MKEHESNETAEPTTAANTPPADGPPISRLMANTAPPGSDRDRAALADAEQALQVGARALAEARSELRQRPRPKPRRQQERVLRVLLSLNVAALLVVTLLPATRAAVRVAPLPSYQPWSEALQAAEQHDWAAAVTVLEAYLSDGVGMPVSERLSALSALSYYASRGRDQAMSRRFERAASELVAPQGAAGPLVREAEAALERDDHAVLSRAWERFQERATQIPAHLFTPLAQSYLEREDGSDHGRHAWMEQAAALLRDGGGK